MPQVHCSRNTESRMTTIWISSSSIKYFGILLTDIRHIYSLLVNDRQLKIVFLHSPQLLVCMKETRWVSVVNERRLFHYRPGIPIGLREVEALVISRKLAYESSRVFNSTPPPPLTSKGYPSYLFLLEAKSTPCGRKDYVCAKSQLTHDLSACSGVPQTTTAPRTGFLWIMNYFFICYLDEFQDSRYSGWWCFCFWL
jgi:hypothetical protein